MFQVMAFSQPSEIFCRPPQPKCLLAFLDFLSVASSIVLTSSSGITRGCPNIRLFGVKIGIWCCSSTSQDWRLMLLLHVTNLTVSYSTRVQCPRILLEAVSTANRLTNGFVKRFLDQSYHLLKLTAPPGPRDKLNCHSIRCSANRLWNFSSFLYDPSQPTGCSNESLAVVGVYLPRATPSGDELLMLRIHSVLVTLLTAGNRNQRGEM